MKLSGDSQHAVNHTHVKKGFIETPNTGFRRASRPQIRSAPVEAQEIESCMSWGVGQGYSVCLAHAKSWIFNSGERESKGHPSPED